MPTAWTRDSGAYSHFNASTPGFSVFAVVLAAKMPPAVVEPEPEANLTGPAEPEANATEPAAEPPVEPPERPARKSWLLALNAAALLTLTAVGLVYWRRRRALRSG